MTIQNLGTKEKNTWCPGCLNNLIELATKQALVHLINKNIIKRKNVVIVTDIGCSSKVYDYINVNAYYSLHGRALPPMFGLKIANPDLIVIGFAGDGGTYNEGVSHLIHNSRYNANMNLIVANNQTFALTTGQKTSTSEQGYVGPSTPSGVKNIPINPIKLALASGATFVGRGFPLELNHLTNLIEKAILHRGFSFIDVLQPCLTFHNTVSFFKKHIYKLNPNKNVSDINEAMKKANEWNYNYEKNSKIAIGVFYKIEKPIFEDKWSQFKKPWYKIQRKTNWLKTIKEFK